MQAPAKNNDPIPQFPSELKALPIWCVWRYEPDAKGEQTKVPYSPSTGRRASSIDSATWVSFETACEAIAGQEEFRLGIFADDSHTFIDLDKCIGAGGIEPWALAVLSRTNSYAELSPSGTGLHIFVRGAVSKASKINGCECYSTARFFTVTGKHVESTPLTVSAMPASELEELRDDIAQDQLRPYRKVQPGAQPASKSSLVLHKYMSKAEREVRLERALSGDISDYGSRSEAIHGVLQLLARKHAG